MTYKINVLPHQVVYHLFNQKKIFAVHPSPYIPEYQLIEDFIHPLLLSTLSMKKTSIFCDFYSTFNFFFIFGAPVDLKLAQDFSEVCVKVSFDPSAGRQSLAERAAAPRGASMQPPQCSPGSAASHSLPSSSSWSSALVWIKWATGMWLFYPSLPQAILLPSAAASFAHA